MTDWLEWKRKAEEELIAERGAAWVTEHSGLLEAQWQQLAALEGFDPETGTPLPSES